MAEKQPIKEQIKKLTDQIEAGIKALFQSGDLEKYQAYLRTMSHFHHYSVNNQMLIFSQCPHATLVAGYQKWQNQFQRHVMRGEKGISILAPTPYKIKVEKEKLDPDTKLPLLDADGNAITEEKEVQIPMFRPVKVFDVSQTDGKPLPERVQSPIAELTGNVEHYEAFMEALRRVSPVPIEIKPLSNDLDGFFSPSKQSITLRAGMSEVQTVCAAVHEIAHSKLHDYAKQPDSQPKDSSTEEIEAESIAYTVCAYFGIETSANSFGYVATWSKDKDLKAFKESLDTIRKTSSDLISGVEQQFKEICKERGIELPKEPEYELVTIPPSREDAMAFAAEYVVLLGRSEARSEFLSTDKIAGRICRNDARSIRDELERLVEAEDESGIYHGAVELLDHFNGLYHKEWQAKEAPDAEKLYMVDNEKYIHVQRSDNGIDYTIYDAASAKTLDGGVLDDTGQLLSAAALTVCKLHNIGDAAPIRLAPLELLKDLQEANELPLGADVQITGAELAKSIQSLYLDKYGLAFLDDFASKDDCLQHLYEDLLTGADEVKYFLSEIVEQKDVYANRAKALLLGIESYQKSHVPLKELDSNERWYVVDNESKHLRITEDGAKYAYELYDKNTLRRLESGTVHDDDVKCLLAAAIRVCETHGYDKTLPFEVLSNELAGILYSLELSSDDDQIVHTEVNSDKPDALPPLPELEQDYPMPDPTVDFAQMYQFGYTDGNTMLPLSKARAKELFLQDVPIFALNSDNTEYMVLDTDDLDTHSGIFGVERAEWEAARDMLQPTPDIIAPNQPDALSYLHDDSAKTQPENYLKNAEMALEDDYGMIDGIINNGPKQPTVADLEAQVKAGMSISLMDLAAATHRERNDGKRRQSVLEQLKKQPAQERSHKTAPGKSAEKEL